MSDTKQSFSAALDFLKGKTYPDYPKDNRSIQRDGWNGKDLRVKLQVPDAHSKMSLPYLYIEYPNGDRCPWLASQTDILREDWNLMCGN